MLPRGRIYRYPPGCNIPDVPVAGVPGGMLPGPFDIGGMPFRDAAFSQPMQTGALASALANASPEQQRTVSYCCCPYTENIMIMYQVTNVVAILTTGIFIFCSVTGRKSIPTCRSIGA